MRGAGRETPLHAAAAHGHAPLISLLLAHGASPAPLNQRGQTALQTAQLHGQVRGRVGVRVRVRVRVRIRARARARARVRVRVRLLGLGSRF